MNREFAENWLNRLKQYWFNKEIENAVSLFKNTTFYQETPFIKPYTTYEEIKEEWQHIKEQDIKNIEFIFSLVDEIIVFPQKIIEVKFNFQNDFAQLDEFIRQWEGIIWATQQRFI